MIVSEVADQGIVVGVAGQAVVAAAAEGMLDIGEGTDKRSAARQNGNVRGEVDRYIRSLIFKIQRVITRQAAIHNTVDAAARFKDEIIFFGAAVQIFDMREGCCVVKRAAIERVDLPIVFPIWSI